MNDQNFVKVYVNLRGEVIVSPPVNHAYKSNTINLDLVKKVHDSTLPPLSKSILNAQINRIGVKKDD